MHDEDTPSSATATIIISAPYTRTIRAALLTLYRLDAEALMHACDAHLQGKPIDAVLLRRRMLHQVDALLEQFGWQQGADETDRTLTAMPELLEEMLYAGLLEASEMLDLEIRALRREPDYRADVRDAAETVRYLLDLLASLPTKP